MVSLEPFAAFFQRLSDHLASGAITTYLFDNGAFITDDPVTSAFAVCLDADTCWVAAPFAFDCFF